MQCQRRRRRRSTGPWKGRCWPAFRTCRAIRAYPHPCRAIRARFTAFALPRQFLCLRSAPSRCACARKAPPRQRRSRVLPTAGARQGAWGSQGTSGLLTADAPSLPPLLPLPSLCALGCVVPHPAGLSSDLSNAKPQQCDLTRMLHLSEDVIALAARMSARPLGGNGRPTCSDCKGLTGQLRPQGWGLINLQGATARPPVTRRLHVRASVFLSTRESTGDGAKTGVPAALCQDGPSMASPVRPLPLVQQRPIHVSH